MARERFYIDGNTVRKLNTSPARRVEERPERQVEHKRKKKTEKALAFDFAYTAFLTCAIICTFVACVSMLTLQAKITTQTKTITKLENTLNTLMADNDAASVRLNSSVDLNEMYRIATQELGMVYPTAGQVIEYESENQEYVTQYQDVPEVN